MKTDDTQISFKLKKADKVNLCALAEKEGLSVSDIVRIAIREKLRSSFFYNKSVANNTKKSANCIADDVAKKGA